MTQLIWLAIALPLVGVLFNGLFGRQAGRKVVGIVGPLVVLLAFLVGVGAFVETLARDGEPVIVHLWTWATIGDFIVPVNLLVDPLSVQMVLIVTGVGFLIHVYATEYMVHRDQSGVHPDRDYSRFFTFLNLFIASMLVLVLGDNFLLLYVGWELVGLCSYLLIGFWFDRPSQEQDPVDLGDGKKPVGFGILGSPAASGMKAFLVNRIGDVGFALGIFLIWSVFGTLQYEAVFSQVAGVYETMPVAVSIIAALLFVGAIGKSAQIPLYVWLPDAMAGPTPVSALIHAATMVTAGIYMVVRSNAIYSLTTDVSLTIAWIGALTAFFAATIALVQVDLKRILAYSTISQLGYMFMAAGIGAYSSAMLHLTTHAFFKALLFLGAGSLMHALHDVIDIRHMGGLRHKMKITWITFWIGGLALAGFPLFSGFFSKDEILAEAFEAIPALWFVGIVTAGLTAFYIFRAIFLAFHGRPRDQRLYDNAHESRFPITSVLVVLAVFTIIAGVLGLPTDLLAELGAEVPNLEEEWLDSVYLTAEEIEHHLALQVELTLLIVSALVAIGGIALAYFFYQVRPSIPQSLARQTRPVFSLLANKYWVDELYSALFVNPARKLAASMANGVDSVLIDRTLVDGTAGLFRQVGQLFSRLQDGYVGHYALATFIGVIILIGYFFLR
jgi:NADH-quinone oxidoreductase subunit L